MSVSLMEADLVMDASKMDPIQSSLSLLSLLLRLCLSSAGTLLVKVEDNHLSAMQFATKVELFTITYCRKMPAS